MRETAEERAARYLREGRSVSGGKDNPPDRYVLITLSGTEQTDIANINNLTDQGYRFVASLPFNYVLMGNYKENK